MKPNGASKMLVAKPFSIRLTDEEKEVLRKRAGSEALGSYIRRVIFVDRTPPSASVRARLSEKELLARILAQLGHAELGPSLSMLSKAASIGALPLLPETEEEIRAACGAIIAMRHDLLSALGLKVHGGRDDP